jgi:2-polyprenyl-3-methyl-5-hydroxy-6-metoxy-1,4-benzoquinol methylase
MVDPLRSRYDFGLAKLSVDPGSRGRVFRAIPIGSKVLDVGCDTGRFGEALARERGCEVHGIERDPEAAREANQRLRRVHVRSADAEGALTEIGSFDAVLFLDVLEHIYDPWSVLRAAHDALRPGGLILTVVPNIAHISVVRRLLQGRFDYQDHGAMDRTHIRWFTRQSLERSLSQSGFVSTRVEVVPVVPWLQELPRFGQALAEKLATIWPNQLGGSLLGIGHRPRD